MINIKGNDRIFHIDLLREFAKCPTEFETVLQDITKGPEEPEVIAIIQSCTGDENNAHEMNIPVIEINVENSSNKVTISECMPKEIKNRVTKMLKQYEKVISHMPGKTSIIKHKIRLNSQDTFKGKQYQVPYRYRQAVEEEIKFLMDNNLIRKSESEYASPIVIVKKKDNAIRLCCDFRKINSITKVDREPLQHPEDLINEMVEAKIFSHLDCTRAFWQIEVEEESKQYTAFTTHEGFYEWNVMPYGLVNSTATFVKMMKELFKEVPHVRYYVDDICVFTENWETHLKTLETVFHLLQQNNLTVAPDKIKIGFQRLDFLGYNIGEGIKKPTQDLTKKILNIETPKTKKEVRAILGLCNFYSNFIKDYTQVVEPLKNLTKKREYREDNMGYGLSRCFECHKREF